MPQKIILVAGARPNFMKIGPLMAEFKKSKRWNPVLVHTGQHYDFKMSEVFFQELNIPKPDIFLNTGGGSHAVQTAAIMVEFEKVLLKEKPELVIVVGDVNSTMACSLVAKKLQIKVAHVESGLRSFDHEMPEEINRLVTDSISDYLFVSEKSGLDNLRREGADPKRVFFVGNIMIDTLLKNKNAVQNSKVTKKLNLAGKKYTVVTIHRPSNVDSKKALLEILEIFKKISSQISIVFPVHPRTKKSLEESGLLADFQALPGFHLTDPLGYIDFVSLVSGASFVLTDSGGVQEETTVLKVPCITMRENTERPSTLTQGTNVLVGRDRKKILSAVNGALHGKKRRVQVPKFWDGKTAKRIAAILAKNPA